jgi:hypothetical protein
MLLFDTANDQLTLSPLHVLGCLCFAPATPWRFRESKHLT